MNPLKVISFGELKKAHDEGRILKDFQQSGESKLYVRVMEGWRAQPCLVENVSFENAANYLGVSDGSDRIFLKRPGFLYQHQGLLGMLVFSMAMVALFGPPKSKDAAALKSAASVQNRFQELTQIQSSLTALSDYVSSQRKTLQDTESTLEMLKQEKGEVERALSIQRPQLDALLAAINHDAMK